MTKSHSMIFRYLTVAAVAGILCYLFPYTQDDWAWGSIIGLRRLTTWFDNYNGRYIGNLIVLALTRSRLLRAAAMSFTFTGIIYCIERITQRQWAFHVTLLCLLLLPRLIFIQTIVWTSGFSNYVTSAFLTLIYFAYLNEHQPGENRSVSFLMCFFLAVLGVCNTLIMEHLTVFHTITSVFMFVYSFCLIRRIRQDYLIYMISCIAGASYMFSNSIFRTIALNGNTYQHIAEGGIIYQALKNYFGMIYHEGYYNNHFVNTLLFAVCYLLFKQFKKTQPSQDLQSKGKICLVITGVVLICSLTTFVFSGYSYIDYDHLPKVGIEGVVSFVSLIAVIVLTLITTYKEKVNKKLVFLWISFVLMITPLFAVSPIGPRCFFASYSVLILIICELFKCISIEQNEQGIKAEKLLMSAGTVLSILCTVFYFRIYVPVYRAEQQRIQSIMNDIALGCKTVEVSHLPYEDWTWRATLLNDNDAWEYRFKLFYGIPEEVDLIVAEEDE